jgi:hypothetical protein
VTRAAAIASGQFVTGGYVTVFDGVVGPWFLPTFVAATGLGSVHYAVLLPSVERCIERVATRRGHGFTDEAATRHMHDQFSGAEIDRRHVLTDPPDDVDAVTDLVFEAFERGSFMHDGGT